MGRMKSGPERELVDDYIARSMRTGRGLGVRSVEEIEVEAGGGKAREAERLLEKAGNSRIIRLDERGKAEAARGPAAAGNRSRLLHGQPERGRRQRE